MGQIRLPVTFDTHDNFRMELIDFEIAPIGLSYNTILGYPALAHLMAATHPAYNLMKMPGSSGVLTVSGDTRHALKVLRLVFRATAVAQPTSTDALEPRGLRRLKRSSCSPKTRQKPSRYQSTRTGPPVPPSP